MPNTIYGGCDCPQCRNKRKRPLPLTDEELLELQRQQRIRKARERKAAELAELEKRKPAPIPPPPDNQQCTVTKSINVPKGHACYPPGSAHFEGLNKYGTYAVLSTSEAITAQGTPLELIDGSVDGRALAKQLGGGALALSRVLPATATGGTVAGGTVFSAAVAGTIAMLLPNNSLASDAAFYSREDFADLTVANTGVRINIKYLPEQSVTAFGVYTGNNPHWRSVPLIAATEQGEQLVADLGEGIGLIWTPATSTRDKPAIPALEGAPQLPGIYVWPEAKQAERFYEHPIAPEDFRDFIIWFPTRPEMSPIYLSVSLRDAPGVVTGQGEDVDGIWLAGAGEGEGVPIPVRIADKFRGRKYSSFDTFRKGFWRAVARDAALNGQFDTDNMQRIKRGGAPVTPFSDSVGGRKTFELHHVEWISKGGEVYNIDNLRAVTPIHHIDHHKGAKNEN